MTTSKEVRKRYYQKNKERILEKTRERYKNNKENLLEYQKKYRKENKNKILNRTRNKRKERILFGIRYHGNKCNSCGNSFDPCQYDFHHLDPESKSFTISENILVSLDKFEEEVAKCELLCANCHRLKHKVNYDS